MKKLKKTKIHNGPRFNQNDSRQYAQKPTEHSATYKQKEQLKTQTFLKTVFFIFRLSLIYTMLILGFLFALYGTFLFLYSNRIFPGVKVAGVELGGKNPSEAYTFINNRFKKQISIPLQLHYQDQTYTIQLEEAIPQATIDEKIQQAYSIGRDSSPLKAFKQQFQALFFQKNIPIFVTFAKQDLFENQITAINQKIKRDPVNAKIIIDPNTQNITITPSTEGIEIDDQQLIKQIQEYLTFTSSAPNTVPTKKVEPSFSTQEAESVKKALEYVKSNPITLVHEDKTWVIDYQTLLTIVNLGEDSNTVVSLKTPGSSLVQTEDKNIYTLLNPNKLEEYLAKITIQVGKPAQNAKFSFNPQNGEVKEIQAASEGKEVDFSETARLITSALTEKGSTTINLPIKTTYPKITNDNIDNIGIKELIGQGVSYFKGSITNRIFNLTLAASRINGTLIAPGEEFSFNNAVGDISGASGYKPAYIIKSGKTVLDDGGGVCQVSTTVFRAALNSGLPITERYPHAYRVYYYEQGGFQPGMDATIFSPTVDFKFKNDTQNYILLQTRVEGDALYVDLYGTKDGREVLLTKPQFLSQTPPPEDIRQEDPTLPKGEVKQVEHAAWGAKVSFHRTVTRGGETLIDEDWISTYRPWANVYLVGTKEG